MADPKDKSEDEGTIVEKEELVEFLTSSSKVRRGLAESLYDQGLNTWELLVDGDQEYFTSFKGVGKKTAEELIIIGGQKKEELSKPPEPARDIRDVLSEVPRVSQGVIDSLIDAGFSDVYRVSAVDPSELREVQGVGPKLSEKIVEACREEAEAHPQSVAGVEEAMSLPADEEAPAEKGEGFLSKLIGKVKAFFSTEKEAPSESAPEVEETPEEGEKEPEEAPPEEESSEKEAEEEKPSEEEPSEGEKEPEETVEEKAEEEPEPVEAEEESSEEKKEEEPSEKEAEEDKDGTPEEEPSEEGEDTKETSEEKEPSDEEPEEPPEEEPRSLWARIKGIFSKKEEEAPSEEPEEEAGEKDETPEEESSEEKPSEDEKGPEEDSAEGEPDEEKEPPEEKGSEEEPSEEKGSSDEEPAEEKPSRDKEEPSEDKPAEEDEAPKLEIEDIHHIPGVDKKTVDLLLSSGYVNLDELREAVPEDLMMIEGIDEDTAKFIYEVLRK